MPAHRRSFTIENKALAHRFFSYGLALAVGVTCVAQLVRDRALVIALAMFVPSVPFAVMAVAWDVWCKGRALRMRWSLLAIGLAGAAFSIAMMWAPALPSEVDASSGQLIRLVQWNTLWGHRLADVVDTLHARNVDIACLSEAPTPSELEHSWRARNEGWSFASVQQGPRSAYWYRLTVMSRHPVRLRQEWALKTGRAAQFEVELPTRVLRILMVDLQSHPLRARGPSLEQVAGIVDSYARAREPIDLVLGDFNTPARFLGFDALAAADGGYRRAAMWSGQWRATWPAFLPLTSLDIDHAWVAKRLKIARAELFSSIASDHRGQEVWFSAL